MFNTLILHPSAVPDLAISLNIRNITEKWMEKISVFEDTQLYFQSPSGKQTAPDQTANPTKNISKF